MTFLTTRVAKSNVEYWEKLRICISYLNHTVYNVKIIGVFNLTGLFIWVDASYSVHLNMCSQTIGVTSMGYEWLHYKSSKQNLNTKS